MVVIHGSTLFLAKMKSPMFFPSFNLMWNTFLITKLNHFNQIGVVSFGLYPKYLPPLVFFTTSLVHIHIIKKVLLNTNTITLLRTGLALLYNSHTPLEFWDEAFHAACYLINSTPMPFSNHVSPFRFLFKCYPDYSFLTIFGSTCWSNLYS